MEGQSRRIPRDVGSVPLRSCRVAIVRREKSARAQGRERRRKGRVIVGPIGRPTGRRHKASSNPASTSEVYGDPVVHPQTEDYWGNVNPIGPRSC